MALGEPAPRGGVALTCIVELDAAFVSIRANAINLHLGARALERRAARRLPARSASHRGVGGEAVEDPGIAIVPTASPTAAGRGKGWVDIARSTAARVRRAHCEDLVREHAEGEDVRGRADWPVAAWGPCRGVPSIIPVPVSLSGETFAAVAASAVGRRLGLVDARMPEACRPSRLCGPSPLRARRCPAWDCGGRCRSREGRRAPPRPERARVAPTPRRRSARASTRVSRRARAP